MFNRRVLSRDRKTATEGAEVTRSGRLFQTRAVATGKARLPSVGNRVRLTINDEDGLVTVDHITSTMTCSFRLHPLKSSIGAANSQTRIIIENKLKQLLQESKLSLG